MNVEMDAEMAWDSQIFKTPQHQKLNRYNQDESYQYYIPYTKHYYQRSLW